MAKFKLPQFKNAYEVTGQLADALSASCPVTVYDT